jgi:hypothetical protein
MTRKFIWDETRILEIESNSQMKEIQGIGPYGVFNKSHQPTQFGYLSHLEPPYQR